MSEFTPINPEEESSTSMLSKILGSAAIVGAAGISAYVVHKIVSDRNTEADQTEDTDHEY